MQIAALILLVTFACLAYLYLWPYIEKPKPKPKIPKTKKDKKASQEEEMLNRQLFVLGLSQKSYRLWEIFSMVITGILTFIMNRNIIAAILTSYVGKYLLRMIIIMRSSKQLNLIDSQTLQFVRGIADNLEVGETMLNAVKHAGLQLKNPLRTLVTNAINSARGDVLLFDAIKGLAKELKTPVFDKLGRTIAKGINEGQSQISFAIRQIETELKENEKAANKRADIIGGYILLILIIFIIGLTTPAFEFLIKPQIREELINVVSWVSIVGAFLNIYMASSFTKYLRMFLERGDLL